MSWGWLSNWILSEYPIIHLSLPVEWEWLRPAGILVVAMASCTLYCLCDLFWTPLQSLLPYFLFVCPGSKNQLKIWTPNLISHSLITFLFSISLPLHTPDCDCWGGLFLLSEMYEGKEWWWGGINLHVRTAWQAWPRIKNCKCLSFYQTFNIQYLSSCLLGGDCFSLSHYSFFCLFVQLQFLFIHWSVERGKM